MVSRTNSLVRLGSSSLPTNKTQCPCITFTIFVIVTLVLVLYFGEEEYGTTSKLAQISTSHIDLEDLINRYLAENSDLQEQIDVNTRELATELFTPKIPKQESGTINEDEGKTTTPVVSTHQSTTSYSKFVTLHNQTEHGFYYQPSANIINANSKYAVIVANRLTAGSEIKYTFNLPIACMAFIEIGYGCFIMIPYHDPGVEVQKAHALISNTLASWNKFNTGLVVLMHIYVEDPEKVVQFSQCSRLFVPGLVEQSCQSSDDFQKLQNVYLLTTDVDLLPLSTKMYHNNAFDWNLINPLKVSTRPGYEALYAALSCIGAVIGVWRRGFDKRDFGVENKAFNSSVIMKIIDQKKDDYLTKRKGNSARFIKRDKIDWYMDQYVASDFVYDYGKKYGWDKVKTWRDDELGRLDRRSVHTASWHNNVDLHIQEVYKDTKMLKTKLDKIEL